MLQIKIIFQLKKKSHFLHAEKIKLTLLSVSFGFWSSFPVKKEKRMERMVKSFSESFRQYTCTKVSFQWGAMCLKSGNVERMKDARVLKTKVKMWWNPQNKETSQNTWQSLRFMKTFQKLFSRVFLHLFLPRV